MRRFVPGAHFLAVTCVDLAAAEASTPEMQHAASFARAGLSQGERRAHAEVREVEKLLDRAGLALPPRPSNVVTWTAWTQAIGEALTFPAGDPAALAVRIGAAGGEIGATLLVARQVVYLWAAGDTAFLADQGASAEQKLRLVAADLGAAAREPVPDDVRATAWRVVQGVGEVPDLSRRPGSGAFQRFNDAANPVLDVIGGLQRGWPRA
jgi:hypothetical protein